MITKRNRNEARIKRHYRIRNKISGTPECPRLSIFISLKNVYAQRCYNSKCINNGR